MSATIFDLACEELERTTGLERLAARGTLRLALKSVGLEPASVTKAQLELVVQKVLPEELRKRAVGAGERACEAILARLAGADAGGQAAAESPDDIFRRLAAR